MNTNNFNLNFFLIILCLLLIIIIIINNLYNNKCEPFATTIKPTTIKPTTIKPTTIKPTPIKSSSSSLKSSSTLKSSSSLIPSSSSILLSLTTQNKQIHLTALAKSISFNGSSNTITTMTQCNIKCEPYSSSSSKPLSSTSNKYVMVFSTPSNPINYSTCNNNAFGQIKLDRSKWTSNNDFNSGMTIFAVLQPLNISTATKPDYSYTGLINIPKKYNNSYYAAPLLLYNVTYCFGKGTDEYNCSFNTGKPCFWSGHNNNSGQLLQLYTLIIKPMNGKIYVTEYINGILIMDGTFDIFSDVPNYAPIYIGSCDVGDNANNVYLGKLAELVIYNIGLSNTDINNNWNYLCNTWNIPTVKQLPV